jgi:hypothetical protein
MGKGSSREEREQGRRVVSEELIKTIRTHIEKGDKAAEKADQHYIAAGQHLKTLKAQHNGPWKEWEALLKDKVGIGKTRASELMAIADGRTTIEEVRADTAKRVAGTKARLKSSASSGENADDKAQPTVAEIFAEKLGASDAEASAEAMKAKFAALDDDKHPALNGGKHPDNDSEEADKPWTAVQEDTAREIIATLRRLDTLMQQLFSDGVYDLNDTDRLVALIPDRDLAAFVRHIEHELPEMVISLSWSLDEDPRCKPEPQDFEAVEQKHGKFSKGERAQLKRERLAREHRRERLANTMN